MPKELMEITMFNKGTICNPSVTDIPTEAASDSFNIDPIAEDGKLKGIPTDTKLEDNCGHQKNVLVQNVVDPTKHDLISYKTSDNTIYATEALYGGSGTETSLGTLTATTDEVTMEVMQGSVYLGQGTETDEEPQWIGRLDHGQWNATPPDTLVMQEDSLYAPNTLNETSTACTDGTYIYMADAGQAGSYDKGVTSLTYASGEITKVRISDAKIIARSTQVLGYVNAICTSYDNESIWVICTEKWNLALYTSIDDINQTILIYKLNESDLQVEKTFTTDLDTVIKGNRAGNEHWENLDISSPDAQSNKWEFVDSYWDGASEKEYQNTFSSILEIYNSSGERKLWVCTTAGALFNATVDVSTDSIEFTDRTPLGLGYNYGTETYTENYMPPGGGNMNLTGGFYNNAKNAWLFPEWFNGSLIQLSGSDDWVGLFLRNGQSSETIKFDIGGSEKSITFGTTYIFSIKQDNVAGSLIDGSIDRAFEVNDSSLRSGDNGIREISNMTYQAPYDLLKTAYAVVKDWSTSSMEINMAEFDNPAYNATHGGNVTVVIVEQDDTTQIPIRISDTVIVGIPSDISISVSDAASGSATTRNRFRRLTKYTTADNWATDTTDDASIRTQFGPPLYLSQRWGPNVEDGKIAQLSQDSSFHQVDAGYFYKFSFMYDGFQESPLGAARHIFSTGKQVRIPFTFNDDNLPKRVTAVRIYRATSISTTDRRIGGFYHFVGELDITGTATTSLSTSSYNDGILASLNEGDQHANNYRVCRFIDSGPAGATYETMSGLLEAMDDSNVQYKLSTQLNDSLFMANCAHHSQDTATNILYKSLPYKPSCINWVFDLLRLPFVPTAIQSFNGRIYVFSENETLKIDPNNMYIEDRFNGAGCLGPDSVAISDFGMCYCDNNNIYLHTGQTPIPIGDSILTGDASRGYLDLLNTSSYVPKVIFESKRKCFIIYLTTALAWSYNVVRQSWNIWTNPNLKAVLNGKKGEVLGAYTSGDDLYDMYSSATLKSDWYWTSKRLSMQHKTQKKKFYEATVAYTGDGSGDTPTVTVYYDYATGATSTTDGGSETNIVKRDLAKEKKRLIQFKIQPGDASTEVDSVGITFRRFRNLIETA
jgi:hypothetical protein